MSTLQLRTERVFMGKKLYSVCNRQILLESTIIGALYVTVTAVAAVAQAPLTYNGGLGWDGKEYYAMARAFAVRQTPKAEPPFVYRLAVPFLAALVNSRDIVSGFRMVNMCASALTVALFAFWLRLYIQTPAVRVLLVLLYLMAFHAPVRYLHWYWVTTDGLTHLGVMAGVLLLHYVERLRSFAATAWMTGFAVISIPVRELMIIFPCALLFTRNNFKIDAGRAMPLQLKRLPSAWLLLPIMAALGVIWIIAQAVIRAPAQYTFQGHISTMLYTKSLVPYVHGWFIAFGPVLVVGLWKAGDCVQYLCKHQAQCAVFVAISVLGWMAGTDTERFLYWTFPITYVIIGRILERNLWLVGHPLLLMTLGVTQAIAHRVFWTLPDYPLPPQKAWVLLTMWGSQIDYLNLWSWFVDRRLGFISLIEYVLLMATLLLWLRTAELRRRLARTAAPENMDGKVVKAESAGHV
jgi:hypothetical protein